MDSLSEKQRNNAMSHIRSIDTTIEIKLRKALWKKGYRYRKNYALLPGKPDIAITKYRIAIFCDSDFFHGKDWVALKERLSNGKNPEYWLPKIQRNMKRDSTVDNELERLGWQVLRFWGSEINNNLEKCIGEIESAIIQSLIASTNNKRNSEEGTDENNENTI